MFRIGDFSKIAQVSGRLLRYYDEIGLLTPEMTDSATGYRYYSARQLPRLNHILVLKELGLSLEQIARLLDQGITIEETRGILMLREAELEQTVQTEIARLHVVKARLQQIDRHGQVQEPDVIVKTVPAQPFLACRESTSSLVAIQRLLRKMAVIIPPLVGQGNVGTLATVIHSPVFDPDSLDAEVGYLVTGKVPQVLPLSVEQPMTLHSLPAVATMATLVHSGLISDIHLSYG